MPHFPTVELHRHFEAGLLPETIATLAARNGVTEARTRSGQVVAGVDPQSPDSIRTYYASVAAGFGLLDGFTRFYQSFGLALSVLQSLKDLEQAVFEQIVWCAERGSLHTELRGSPFTYQEQIDAPLDDIAAALVAGVDRAWAERGASGTFILAFSRQKGLAPPEAPPVQRQAEPIARLAAALHRVDRPVGLDIAGFPETPWPPRLFKTALAPAREAGVPLTVHVGEQGRSPDFADAPPTLIVEAIEHLGARRIGHGTSLVSSAAARDLVHDRGVGVECCPISNARMGFVAVEEHPLPLLLADGLCVSLSTDDPLMFGPFTVAETFDEIAGPLGLGASSLLTLTRNGIESAFVTDERRSLLRHRLHALTTDDGTDAHQRT
jgi:adenosine deaminase